MREKEWIGLLTGKQKRFLRAQGNEMEVILTIGKGGITDAVVAQAEEALEARELIKGRVLPVVLEEPESVAAEIVARVGAELVQVIGRNFLLYRKAKNKVRIILPE